MVKDRKPKLPAKQLAILAICRFAEPIALTSVYPYLPEMIESFGIRKKLVPKWAGITSAVFSLAQCTTAIAWGRSSDTFGRKPTILLALTLAMIASTIWGFSTTLPMAIVARSLAGACNGNVGIIRTMVAEMVPEKELQPIAFSIMPLMWTIGSIFGPSLGGALAKPAENIPSLFGHNEFLKRYPFALPNLVSAAFFIIGITIGILFLKETLESQRHKVDYGLELGEKLTSCVATPFCSKTSRGPPKVSTATESTSLLHNRSTKSSSKPKSLKTSSIEPVSEHGASLKEVFTTQSVINLTAYTLLAMHNAAFDQLVTIFMHNPRVEHIPENTSLPFKFAGGFGLGSGRIGAMFTMYGIVGCFVQFLVFPPMAAHFGVLNCYKACGITFPLVSFIAPYTALIENKEKQQGAMFVLLLIKSIAGIFAFPSSIIMLTNSATSLRILGTLNGFAVAISALGRAAGPAICGLAFSWGMEKGYVVTPWFLLGIIAFIGAVPIWFLVEMDGIVESRDEEDEDEMLLIGDGLEPEDEPLYEETDHLLPSCSAYPTAQDHSRTNSIKE